VKPRAHQSQFANYWVVWSVENGDVIQGIGRDLEAAFYDWLENGFILRVKLAMAGVW
jgi:hypothetical protein